MSLFHKDLGKIILKTNKQAKRIIIRYRNDRFELTHPDYLSHKEIFDSLERMKDRILSLKKNVPPKILYTPDSNLSTYTFDLNIKESTCTNFYVTLKDKVLNIICPINTNYRDASVQSKIKCYIKNALYNEAKQILPNKLKKLANEYHFNYTSVRINKSQGRWGSCSSKGNINLSFNCMLLPSHLIDFIILHELCHTIEMNHGSNFWLLLNKVTNNKAKAFTNELKNYKTNW